MITDVNQYVYVFNLTQIFSHLSGGSLNDDRNLYVGNIHINEA